MTLVKWLTWCTITLYNTSIIIIFYMFRANLWSSLRGKIVFYCCINIIWVPDNALRFARNMQTCFSKPSLIWVFFKNKKTTHVYDTIQQCKVDDKPQDRRCLEEGDECCYSCNISWSRIWLTVLTWLQYLLDCHNMAAIIGIWFVTFSEKMLVLVYHVGNWRYKILPCVTDAL